MPAGMPSRSQQVLIKPISCQRVLKRHLNLCLLKTHPLSARTRNASQNLLTKPVPCQRGHKMHHNMWSPNPTHANEDKIVCQVVLTKPIPCQWRLEMNLNICWTNRSLAREDSNCISICVDQTPRSTARRQNVSQHMLSKPIPCQRRKKMWLNLCWPDTPMLSMRQNVFQHVTTNPSRASEDTKCISACIDQTHPMPATT